MNSYSETYYSRGKLLITGEYVILDGAKGLALPTKLGQSLKVTFNNEKSIYWKSYDHSGDLWYENKFDFDNEKKVLKSNSQDKISIRIQQIFDAIFQLNPNFIIDKNGILIETFLEFDRLWGLGTSSTLINNLAYWAEVDAYELLALTFGGSGYDIACAQHHNPIAYQIKNSNKIIETVHFDPPFKSNLYFVYLNKKQNSRSGIAHYKAKQKNDSLIDDISNITESILQTKNQVEFSQLLQKHEQLISKAIDLPTVQATYFSDFNGQIKSLGAWGGDFVLVSCFENPSEYFKSKGFEIVLDYNKLIN